MKPSPYVNGTAVDCLYNRTSPLDCLLPRGPSMISKPTLKHTVLCPAPSLAALRGAPLRVRRGFQAAHDAPGFSRSVTIPSPLASSDMDNWFSLVSMTVAFGQQIN